MLCPQLYTPQGRVTHFGGEKTGDFFGVYEHYSGTVDMKIGLIVDPYGEKAPGGLGRATFELAKNIIAMGTNHTFTVYVKSLPREKPEFPGSHWSLRSLNSRYILLTGARNIDPNLDLYIFFSPIIPLFLYPKKSIVVALDFAYLDTPQRSLKMYLRGKLLYRAHRHSLRSASKIIAISEDTAQSVMAHFGISRKKIEVVHIGYMPLPAEQKAFTTPGKFFLFAGVMKERKNVAGVIRAFALFCQVEPSGYHLLLAGKQNGEYYDSLVTLVKELDLTARVTFLGYVSDAELANLYSKAEALVFPSFIEGFGMPVLEAMHAGLPVITSNVGALAEVAGDAALLVDPKNPEDIAAAMRRLTGDNGLRRELVKKGRVRASQFSWKETARLFLKIIETLR